MGINVRKQRSLMVIRVPGVGKNLIRAILRTCGVCLYQAGLASWIIRCSPRTRVVLYHAVESTQGSYTRGLGICVSPETLALHLDYYSRFYAVVSMKDYLDGCGNKPAELTCRAPLLITFDDGYASVKEHALPLLEAQNMHATVYLIGNAVKGRMVWVNRLNQAINDFPGQTREVLSAYPGLLSLNRRSVIHRIQTTFAPGQIKSLIHQLEDSIPDLTCNNEKLFVTPDDIRQMQRRGIEFGFHTNDHWNLGRCKDDDLRATLSTTGLEGLINSNTFAYPFGYFSPAAIGQLKRQGYQKLLTVGSNNERFSELHLDRTEVFETTYAKIFARLEIEEPVISAMRRLLNRCKLHIGQLFAKSEKQTA